jgi:hypothetical protein
MGAKGTTAQPFDGGALTLGWTRALAKGRAVAPLFPPATMVCHYCCCFSSRCGTEQRWEKGEQKIDGSGRTWSSGVSTTSADGRRSRHGRFFLSCAALKVKGKGGNDARVWGVHSQLLVFVPAISPGDRPFSIDG